MASICVHRAPRTPLDGTPGHIDSRDVLQEARRRSPTCQKICQEDLVGLKNSTIEKKLGYLRWFLNWATSGILEKNRFELYQTRTSISLLPSSSCSWPYFIYLDISMLGRRFHSTLTTNSCQNRYLCFLARKQPHGPKNQHENDRLRVGPL